jgi:hypothetical protein
MRFVLLLAAAVTPVVLSLPADAQSRRRPPVVDVKPRSFLDAGRTVRPGALSNYVYDQMPARPGADVTFGRFADQALPGRFSGRGFDVDFVAPAALRR